MAGVQISDEIAQQFSLRTALRKLDEHPAASTVPDRQDAAGGLSTCRWDEERYDPAAVVSAALRLSSANQRRGAVDSLLLPNHHDLLGKRATYVTTSSAAGGALVEPERAELAQALKPVSVLDRLGVRRVDGLDGGSVHVASITAGATAAHFGEAAVVPESGGAFGGGTEIKAHHVGVRVDVARQMLIQSAYDLDAWVTSDLVSSLAAAVETGVIAGDGLNNKPVGLIATSGVGAKAFAGATPTFNELVDMLDLLGAANVPMENVRWLMHPQMLARVLKLADTANQPLFGAARLFEPGIVLTSASCPLTKIVAGDWSRLTVFSWGRTELARSTSVRPDFLSRFMLSSFYAPWVEQPAAFAVGTAA
jgi:HK97 family phage major capsid protein